MRRLRHPIRSLKEPFGKAGFTLAILALVLAMAGGAWAAAALSGKQKKEVEKIAKKFAGKPGTPGANGTAGAPGAKGDAGAAGANGTSGAAGKSVVLVDETPSGCLEGGFAYEVEGSGEENEVCNGEEGVQGEDGEDGEPWTAGGTLPPGETETGVWLGVVSEAELELGVKYGFGAISFPIPLAAPLDAAHVIDFVHVDTSASEKEKCENADHAGSAGTDNPEASPGYLCVYKSLTTAALDIAEFTKPLGFEQGAGVSGSVAILTAVAPGVATGSWAVTAPAAP